jgi:hypothetical protein
MFSSWCMISILSKVQHTCWYSDCSFFARLDDLDDLGVGADDEFSANNLQNLTNNNQITTIVFECVRAKWKRGREECVLVLFSLSISLTHSLPLLPLDEDFVVLGFGDLEEHLKGEEGLDLVLEVVLFEFGLSLSTGVDEVVKILQNHLPCLGSVQGEESAQMSEVHGIVLQGLQLNDLVQHHIRGRGASTAPSSCRRVLCSLCQLFLKLSFEMRSSCCHIVAHLYFLFGFVSLFFLLRFSIFKKKQKTKACHDLICFLLLFFGACK